MKLLNLTIGMALMATSAIAADVKTPVPTCGKTPQDCQKVIDADDAMIKTLKAAYQGATLQRDQATKSLNDTQLQAYITQQSTPTTPNK